jgi:hypothetical protein
MLEVGDKGDSLASERAILIDAEMSCVVQSTQNAVLAFVSIAREEKVGKLVEVNQEAGASAARE